MDKIIFATVSGVAALIIGVTMCWYFKGPSCEPEPEVPTTTVAEIPVAPPTITTRLVTPPSSPTLQQMYVETPPVYKPNSGPADVVIEMNNTDGGAPVALVEENPISFTCVVENQDSSDHETLEDAIENLQLRKKFASTSAFSLKIYFPPKMILDHKTREQFRSWLARVGDYIYVLRMLNVVDPDAKVMRNPDLSRILPNEDSHSTGTPAIAVRGNVKLIENEDEWNIEIRGLRERVADGNREKDVASVDGINEVAKIILRALGSPEHMIDFPGFPVERMSNFINNRLVGTGQKKLDSKETNLTNNFLRLTTYDKYFRGVIKDNLRSFLPLVSFVDTPNILPEQKEKLIVETNKFADHFIEKLLPKISTKPNDSTDCLFDLRVDIYHPLIKSLLTWMVESDVKTIIKQSLFREGCCI